MFSFPPGWRGRLLQRVLRRELINGPAEALASLKRAAESASDKRDLEPRELV